MFIFRSPLLPLHSRLRAQLRRSAARRYWQIDADHSWLQRPSPVRRHDIRICICGTKRDHAAVRWVATSYASAATNAHERSTDAWFTAYGHASFHAARGILTARQNAANTQETHRL